MTITITASTFTLSGPLVAGERVGVSVSGFSFAEGVAPVLTLSSRFPAALLASVELAEDEQTPGTWTGELDTATKGTGAFMMTARADERRDAVLELVAGRESLARLSVPLVNSALCPRPPRGADTSPVFVPGPQGDAATVEIGETTTLPAGSDATVTNTGTAQAAVFNFGIPRGEPGGSDVEPSDTTPLMDGTGAAGAAEKYARGDHRHPTDTSRAAASDVAAIQAVIPSNATASNKLATASDIPAAQVQANWTEADASSKAYIQNKPALATVATSGAYSDLTGKPTIPAAQVNADWNATSGVAEILNKPTIPSVPSASTATPAMDGTGAAGIATSYARGDHVHPTDTSRVAVAGDTMTGPLTAPAFFTDANGGFVIQTSDSTAVAFSSRLGQPGVFTNADGYLFRGPYGAPSGSSFDVGLRGILPVVADTTLSTVNTVYRATATGGVIPTVDVSGIPACNAYFAFELEIAVPAGATLDDRAISSWTWLDGGELPTSDYAGKTLYIAARLDCTANVRTVLANCWRVA